MIKLGLYCMDKSLGFFASELQTQSEWRTNKSGTREKITKWIRQHEVVDDVELLEIRYEAEPLTYKGLGFKPKVSLVLLKPKNLDTALANMEQIWEQWGELSTGLEHLRQEF